MTQPRCVGALLARNEAAPDRYLSRVLDNAARFCDGGIIVVDDASTDATPAIARAHASVAHIETRDGAGWWGADEGSARAVLWNLASMRCGPLDWIYVFDADHELVGIEPPDLRLLLRSTAVNAWACPLWDCWDSDATMRADGFWQAHRHPRAWLARAWPHEAYSAKFGHSELHSGHLPTNYPLQAGIMPQNAAIRHLGYCNSQHRKLKYEAYLRALRG